MKKPKSLFPVANRRFFFFFRKKFYVTARVNALEQEVWVNETTLIFLFPFSRRGTINLFDKD